MKPTPTPWHIDKTTTPGQFCWNYVIRSKDDSCIATIGPCAQEENAEFIITTCNAHKELVSLLKRLVSWEYDPDKYTGDLADIAIDARKLLDTIEKGAS